MSREEIQKLLGGYATDTLSETERHALFEAALEDQQLFDALAKEQALRDVLADPQARRQLLAALEPAPEPLPLRAWRWLRQPAALAAAAALATLLIVTAVVRRRNNPPAPKESLVAEVKTPALSAPLPSAAPLKEFQPPSTKPRLERPAPLPAPPPLPQQDQMAKALLPSAPNAPEPPHADTLSADARPVREQPAAPKTAAAAHTSAGAAKRGAAFSTTSHSAAPAASSAPVPPVETARQLYSQQDTQTLGISGRLPAMRSKTMQGATTPIARNLGVRYGLLRKGLDGEYSPVALDTVFHSGDSLRLQLEPNDSGYLYLFQRDVTGGWRLASTQRVERAQRCLLPPGGALQYDQPGSKELLVILSRQEQPSLAGLDTTQLDALASNAGANLLKAAVSNEQTAYAVDTRAQTGEQRVSFEIILEYR